ncbi:acyltransferase [Antrihabitans sp. YC2-6]|uniref:acyltransferase family protein n=1 Tax=Antrihabitans sp. YC2-6 TaxID=2799498 RepID=UPI0018F58D3B|nr:acyltransferase [Antrihabitans sp. YC2-6]MBJ8343674.1 acyltransferase [Antrihabitans sp. YC2-6]
MRLLPSAATVEALTPRTRDRSLDLVRLASLLVVISGHGLMLLVTVGPGTVSFGNLLTGSATLQALTWILQVLPLFFFAGAASSAMSWRPGNAWGAWLMRRAQRLYRPVFYYLAAWAVALFLLRDVMAPNVNERIAAISTQLLWFIGVYIVVLAFVPALAAMQHGWQVATVVLGLYCGAAAVDAIRLGGGPESLGYLNLLVWLIPAALGIGYVRGLISRFTAGIVAMTSVAANVLLVLAGPYEVSLVTVDGQRLSNMTPPSLLLAGHAIALSCLFILASPWCGRFARRPRVWRIVALGNGGAMTLYLWHMPALLTIAYISHLLGFDRSDPAQPGFAVLVVVQLGALYSLTAALFLALSPLEDRKLPWWDDAIGLRHSAVVGAAVVTAGIATLLAAKWGFVGTGVWCTLISLAALATARVAGRPPRGLDSWPGTPPERPLVGTSTAG